MSHVPHWYTHARALLARSHAKGVLRILLCAETEMAPNPCFRMHGWLGWGYGYVASTLP